jgi:hypothetical protein
MIISCVFCDSRSNQFSFGCCWLPLPLLLALPSLLLLLLSLLAAWTGGSGDHRCCERCCICCCCCCFASPSVTG